MTRSFATAATVDDALAALASGARPVAGGTDLVVGARQGKAPLPQSLVAIHRLEELRGIQETADGIRIGALTSHAELVSSAVVRERLTALADAAAIVGSHATRAQGTLGGNLMNASPAMETGGPLVCFDAVATLRSSSGTRDIRVAELFAEPGATIAAPDELLTGVDIAAPRAQTGSAYVRLEYRRHMEIAVVGATAAVTVDGDTVTDMRIAITALAPTIRRVPAAEQALQGTSASPADIEAAANAAAADAAPISDVRASEGYRRAMAAVIARRAIAAALTRAHGGDAPIPASSHLR